MSVHAGTLKGLGEKCLDVPGGVAADGTPVQIFSCHGGPSQELKMTQVGDNASEIKFGSMCLDISAAVIRCRAQVLRCNFSNATVVPTRNGL
jgi:hypothetical protein